MAAKLKTLKNGLQLWIGRMTAAQEFWRTHGDMCPIAYHRGVAANLGPSQEPTKPTKRRSHNMRKLSLAAICTAAIINQANAGSQMISMGGYVPCKQITDEMELSKARGMDGIRTMHNF